MRLSLVSFFVYTDDISTTSSIHLDPLSASGRSPSGREQCRSKRSEKARPTRVSTMQMSVERPPPSWVRVNSYTVLGVRSRRAAPDNDRVSIGYQKTSDASLQWGLGGSRA